MYYVFVNQASIVSVKEETTSEVRRKSIIKTNEQSVTEDTQVSRRSSLAVSSHLHIYIIYMSLLYVFIIYLYVYK